MFTFSITPIVPTLVSFHCCLACFFHLFYFIKFFRLPIQVLFSPIYFWFEFYSLVLLFASSFFFFCFVSFQLNSIRLVFLNPLLFAPFFISFPFFIFDPASFQREHFDNFNSILTRLFVILSYFICLLFGLGLF